MPREPFVTPVPPSRLKTASWNPLPDRANQCMISPRHQLGLGWWILQSVPTVRIALA
ncbi:hypothetical protein JMJ78_0000966, partial [Colletotrichum scovillei]